MAFLHKALALLALIAVSLSFLAQPAEAAKGPLITHKASTSGEPLLAPMLIPSS